MMIGVDDVSWSELWHAHGSAEDVPSMLFALTEPETCEQACADLHETVWHQGTIYPASAATLPFLFQIASSPSVHGTAISPDKLAASLVAAIATGEGWIQRRIAALGEANARTTLESLGRNFDDELKLESQTLRAIRQTVLENIEVLKQYQNEPEGLGEMISEVLRLPLPTEDASYENSL